MADIKGLGLCGVCLEPIEENVPIRHFSGHTMAHKDCKQKHDAHLASPEYKIEKARQRFDSAQYKLGVAKAELEDSYAALVALDPSAVSEVERLVYEALKSNP